MRNNIKMKYLAQTDRVYGIIASDITGMELKTSPRSPSSPSATSKDVLLDERAVAAARAVAGITLLTTLIKSPIIATSPL